MDRTSLREALKASVVRPIVAKLMDDPSEVEGVVHDNGFYKLTLGQSAGGVVLRAHVWLGDQRFHQGDGNIHNHRWNFASRILQGVMTTVSFKADDGGELSLLHHAYRPDADPEIQYVGVARLCQVSSETFTDGDFYYLDATTIHRAQPGSGRTTVTLVARSKAERQYADVYATRHLAQASHPPTLLPPNVVACELSRLHGLLLAGDQ